MYLRRHRAAAILLGAVLAQMFAAPTQAGFGDPVVCDAEPTAPECLIDVVDGGHGGDDGGSGGGVTRCHDFVGEVAPCFVQKWGWASSDGCYYKSADPDLAAALGRPVPPAAWYEGSCVDVANNIVVLTRLRVFSTPPGQALLVAEAIKRLRLPAPAIRVNPAPPAAQLVFVPTWLWLERPLWGARSATASVPVLSVTATATPRTVAWSTGDGAAVTCHGPGSAWRTGTDPKAASPDCGHTYTRPSGEGTFTLTATITWNVSWTGGGISGTEAPLTSTASVPLKVAESVTVNTNAGG